MDGWSKWTRCLQVFKSEARNEKYPYHHDFCIPGASVSALEAGANGFMEKPYTMQDMLATVKKHITKISK